MYVDPRGLRFGAVVTTIVLALGLLTQSVWVSSVKVQEVKKLSEQATELIREGIEIRSGAPQFMLSKPDAVKANLLAEATKNAFERANTLAKGSGATVGALQSASQGLIQILPRGIVDNSEYPRDYDITTIAKTMRAVVSLEYAVER